MNVAHGFSPRVTPAIGQSVSIAPGSLLGLPTAREIEDRTVRIGDGATIGAFVVIEEGVTIGRDVEIDHYCRIGSGSIVMDQTRLVYGCQLYDDVRVGARCIIGGNLDDRVVVEDDVTYMGRMAHSYRTAGTLEDWEGVAQPSPVIKRWAVVGQDALLLGGVEIGERAYIGAGEVVRSDIPAGQVLYRGKLSPLSAWRGLIQSRTDFIEKQQ